MATTSFYLRGNKKEKTIYVRFRNGISVDLKTSTPFRINKEYWDKRKGIISLKADFIEREHISRGLDEIRNNIRISVMKNSKDFEYNLEWLKLMTHENSDENKTNSEIEVIELLKMHKQQLIKKNENISPGTLRNYNTTISRLKKWQESNNKKLFASELSLLFHSDYIDFCRQNLKLSLNSIGKDIRNIKAACSIGEELDFTINTNVRSRKFKAPIEKTIFTTLSVEEINVIYQQELPNYLSNARDWLIIGCWVGARVEDLLNLNTDTKLQHGDKSVLKYTQSKTGKPVMVPLHKQVEEILNKNNGFPRKISSVKFNEYIKLVCKLAELNKLTIGKLRDPETKEYKEGLFPKWKLITSHICRRSFATNHYNTLPNKVIMAVTGHATEKMLLQYIGELEVDHIDKFFEAWS
jgi:integrase